MLKRNSLFIVFFFLAVSILNPLGENFYSINKIISFYNLDVDYDNIRGCLKIGKNDKIVAIYLNSCFIFIGNKKYFIKSFVRSGQGEFYIPTETAMTILNYFKTGKNDFVTKNNDIYVEGKKSKKNIEDYSTKSVMQDISTDEVKKESEISRKTKDQTNDTDSQGNKLKGIKKFAKINAIIIDPGHGGKDPGAIGYNDIKEKDIVLRTGLFLSEIFKTNFPDKKIVLTRDNDRFIELEDRSNIANKIYDKYGTTIFVSIHVNASRSEKAYGFETYYLVGNYSRKVVKKGSVSNDKSIESVLNSMLNEEIYKESKDLAGRIQRSLEKQVGYASENRNIKEQVYFVIKKSVMPAVLVEIGFNTNKYEAIRLTKYSYLNKIAFGIYSGVKDFIDGYEKTEGFTR